MSLRLVYVDDTNPLISYHGPWAEYPHFITTNWGPPFNYTLHALSGSGSFTFFFTGTSVSVIGSFQLSSVPSWKCFVDGNALTSKNMTLYTHNELNNVELCALKNIVPKATPRNLTVVASGTTHNPFLFNRVEYAPDASVILDNATIVVNPFDGDIVSSTIGWTTLESGIVETSMPGAFLIFNFVGTQITWITSLYYNSMNITLNSLAQYSIDNGDPVPFQVAAHSSTDQFYNQVTFQTPVLSLDSHRLFVKYGAENLNGSAPLILDHFVIQNHTIVSFTPRAPNTTSASNTTSTINTKSPTLAITQSPTITRTTQTFSRAGLSEGTIAGVVIGSIVGLALIIFILIWTIRFIKGKRAAASLGKEPVPYMADDI